MPDIQSQELEPVAMDLTLEQLLLLTSLQRSQQLRKAMMMMQGTQPLALTGNSVAHKRDPLSEINRGFQAHDGKPYAPNQKEAATEDVMNLYTSTTLKIKS